MITFLLILIAVTLIFDADAGAGFLVWSVVGFLIFCAIALIVAFHSQVWTTAEALFIILIWGGMLYGLGNSFYKGFKKGDFSKKELLKLLKRAFSKEKILRGIYFTFIIAMTALTVFFLMAILSGSYYYSGVNFNIVLACFFIIWIVWVHFLIKRNRTKKQSQKEY